MGCWIPRLGAGLEGLLAHGSHPVPLVLVPLQVGTLQRRREVSFLVEDGPCPPGVDCRSCEPGVRTHPMGLRVGGWPKMKPRPCWGLPHATLCSPQALQHCVGTVSIEQQPTAELRCRPLRPQVRALIPHHGATKVPSSPRGSHNHFSTQPIRNWWIRIWEWLNGIRKRLRQRSPFYVRGHLNVTSTPQP